MGYYHLSKPLKFPSSKIRKAAIWAIYQYALSINTWLYILPGGGPLVFKGGYHAWVWPLKTDPKQGF